jgi:hypothetical protein
MRMPNSPVALIKAYSAAMRRTTSSPVSGRGADLGLAVKLWSVLAQGVKPSRTKFRSLTESAAGWRGAGGPELAMGLSHRRGFVAVQLLFETSSLSARDNRRHSVEDHRWER